MTKAATEAARLIRQRGHASALDYASKRRWKEEIGSASFEYWQAVEAEIIRQAPTA
jgi:hypothetical protein